MADLLTAFGLLAAVLTITALSSGFIRRSPLSFPLMFLTLGLVLGQNGLGFINVSPHDPILEIVATLTLSLVLFLDALQIQIRELGKRWLVPALILGPGTVLIITLGAIPLALMLGLHLDRSLHRRRCPRIDRPCDTPRNPPRRAHTQTCAAGIEDRSGHQRPCGIAGHTGSDSSGPVRDRHSGGMGSAFSSSCSSWGLHCRLYNWRPRLLVDGQEQ